MCANASQDELVPLTYALWPGTVPINTTLEWPTDYGLNGSTENKNESVFDELMGFGPNRRPPIFPRLPKPLNSVLGLVPSTSDTLYLLFASNQSITPGQTNYMMCSASMTLEQGCSTQYTASSQGGSMVANCDADNKMAYRTTNPTGIRSSDWQSIAEDWAKSLALAAGIVDAYTSDARLLTQLIPQKKSLDPTEPSVAEALAVLAGCTLLQSATGAPPTEQWPYKEGDVTADGILAQPHLDSFQASVQTSDYASGGTEEWQVIFYVTLSFVFLINCFCLAYFVVVMAQRGLVHDFIDPPNFFTLALNSPASSQVAGCCGGGPSGGVLRSKWYIREDENKHVYIGDAETVAADTPSELSLRSPGRTPLLTPFHRTQSEGESWSFRAQEGSGLESSSGARLQKKRKHSARGRVYLTSAYFS